MGRSFCGFISVPEKAIIKRFRKGDAMRTECTKYMYDGKWTQDFLERSRTDYHTDDVPEIKAIENALLLPQKDAAGHSWGIGGAVSPDGRIVEETCIGQVFGGTYQVRDEDIQYSSEIFYFIPIIPRHWGHFLIDVLSRFWFIIDGSDKGYRIAFCGKDFPDNKITENYLEALKILGVDEKRLLFVEKPMKVAKILIPEASYGDGKPYSDIYLKIIQSLKENALAMESVKRLNPIEKVYFTRQQFRRAHMTEVGEKEIEVAFRSSGFTVLAPEKLSVEEQVYYFATAGEIASISGTISHNIVFCEEGTKVAVLNRCCLPNIAQFSINQISKATVTYIDVYAKETMKRAEYWPVWVEVNDNLDQFMNDNGHRMSSVPLYKRSLVKLRNYGRYEYLIQRMNLKRLLRR